MKKLKPTNDYVFKKIFGSIDSEDITREFIKMKGYWKYLIL